jgi:hypothetical protein
VAKCPSAAVGSAACAGQEHHPAGAGAQQRLDELLGVQMPLSGDHSEARVDRGLARYDDRPIDLLQAGDPVPGVPALERFELVDLVLVVRDDQLAGAHVRDAVAGAERVHQVAPFHAQPRLERAGRIVEPRVDHSAVVGAGVHPRARMPLEHAHRHAGGRDRARRGQACDTPADDCDVDPFQGSAPVAIAA